MKRVSPWKLSLLAVGFAMVAVVTAMIVSPAFGATPRQPAPAVHRGHAVIHFPSQTEWAKLKRTHKSDGIFPAVSGSGDLAYGGAAVQRNPVSYLIFWGSGWSNTSGSTASIIQSWFNDYGGSGIANVLTQYSDTTGHINNNQTLAGVYFDSATPPTDSTCTANKTIEDSSVQSEVSHAISTNGWATNSTGGTYFVFLPNGDSLNDGTGACDANGGGSYCAYHNFSSSANVEYGAEPFPNSGCTVSTSPNNNVSADSEINLTSHEQAESITDPLPPGNGWVDAAGYEIGDKCAWDFSAGLTHTQNGGTFEVQTEYSNATHTCVNTYGSTPTPTPTPIYTPTPTPTPSNTPTPTPTPGGSGGSIVNGGFETGSFSGWTTGGQATSISTSSHSGTYAGQAGSTSPTNGDSTIAQTFTVPSGQGTLSFYYKVVCPDTVTYDWATATLKDNTSNTTSTVLGKTCNNSNTWVLVSAGVTAGHSYTLTLVSHDDNYAADPTYTLYDDVAVR